MINDSHHGPTLEIPSLSFQEWWQQEQDVQQSSSDNSTQQLLSELSSQTRTQQQSIPTISGAAVMLLDIRTEIEYHRIRLERADSSTTDDINNNTNVPPNLIVVHIPMEELPNRLFELPPRSMSFGILASFPKDENTTFRFQLENILANNHNNNNTDTTTTPKNGSNVKRKVRSATTATTTATPAVRRISVLFNAHATTNFWNEVTHNGNGLCVVYGSTIEDPLSPSSLQSRYKLPQPRLWQPDPLVQDILLPLLCTKLQHSQQQQQQQQSSSTKQHRFQIWDLASGYGRDVAFLAEELLRMLQTLRSQSISNNLLQSTSTSTAFRVVGLDQRYRNMEQNETLQFWARRQLEHFTEARCIQLQNVNDVVQDICMAVPPVTCLYAVRYWNQPLMAAIAQTGIDGKLYPNTVVAVSHFGKASIDAEWNFPHPKVN